MEAKEELLRTLARGALTQTAIEEVLNRLPDVDGIDNQRMYIVAVIQERVGYLDLKKLPV